MTTSLPLVRPVLAAVLLIACARRDDTRPDSAAAAAPDTAAKASPAMPLPASARVASVPGFKTPESVRYDESDDVYLVSNINGNPSQKDNNGYIAKMSAANPGSPTVLAEGGKNGVTLNAPKGMAIVGDTLWVADIDAVRAFNRKTGAPIRTVDLRAHKAAFLNDVAAAPDGAILVTDTGIRFDSQGRMSPAGAQQVFRIAGTTVSVALSGDSLGNPNGITWDTAHQAWLMAGFSGKDIVRFTEGDTKPTVVASGPGGYDGLEVLPDGRILVTSWSDSSVSVVEGTGLRKLIAGVSAPADIGIDTKRMRVALPRFELGTVEIWSLK